MDKPMPVPVSPLALAACATAGPRTPMLPVDTAVVDLIAVGDTPYRPQDVAAFEALLHDRCHAA